MRIPGVLLLTGEVQATLDGHLLEPSIWCGLTGRGGLHLERAVSPRHMHFKTQLPAGSAAFRGCGSLRSWFTQQTLVAIG